MIKSLIIVELFGDSKKLERRTAFASLSLVERVLQVGLVCGSQFCRRESPPAWFKVWGFFSNKTSPAEVTTLSSALGGTLSFKIMTSLQL